MMEHSSLSKKLNHYFPKKEVALVLFSVLLTTLTTTLNFFYGKKKISTPLFITLLLLAQMLSYAIMLRGIYYRLRSTNLSNKINQELGLSLLLSQIKDNSQQPDIDQINYHINLYEQKIKNDYHRFLQQIEKEKKYESQIESLEKYIKDQSDQNLQSVLTSIKDMDGSDNKELVEKIKIRIQICQYLKKTLKNKDNTSSNDKTEQKQPFGIVTFLNNHVVGTVIACAMLQISSIGLSISAPILYKKGIVSISLYFAMILLAYAFITITTTIFTINRVVDRKVKQENHEKVLRLLQDENKSQENITSSEKTTSLDYKQRLEIGINFILDTLARGVDIIANFLYSSQLMNSIVYIGIICAVQVCEFSLMLYSMYDRFSALKLAENDRQNLSKRQSKDKTTNDQNAIKTSLALMVSIFVVSQLIAITGKIAVPFFYKQDKLGTIAYFSLIFVSIFCGSCVRFLFYINRSIDTEVTEGNHKLILQSNLNEVQAVHNNVDKEIS